MRTCACVRGNCETTPPCEDMWPHALLDQKKMKAKEEKSLLHVIITHASTTKNIIEISDNSTF